MVSVVIPSRNEPYLHKTIQDVLLTAVGEIEVWAILDGYWADEYSEDPRVHYIHNSIPLGMRRAINDGVAVARGEFILKTDAHCSFSPGWDKELASKCKDNYVVVPRRYALEPIKWTPDGRTDGKYPIDEMFFDEELHGVPGKNRYENAIHDIQTAQGSAWFMRKDYFHYLELLDEETYGTFWQEFTEIALKAWLSGGRVIVDTNVAYAHFHKNKGRGYKLPEGEKEKTQEMVMKWKDSKKKVWHKQIHDFNWLMRKWKKD